MQQEIELIPKAVVNEVPVLGICPGAQLMSKSPGGQVHPGKFIEVGWHQVELLPEAANDA
jgi:GMP synthase-like glutamine amidotransferase